LVIFAVIENIVKRKRNFQKWNFEMEETQLTEEGRIIQKTTALMRQLIPAGWLVEATVAEPTPGTPRQTQARPDATMTLRAPDGTSATIAVEARRSLSPRDVDRVFVVFARLRMLTAKASALVVAPWLSQRTQDLLAADNINYLDLTGNVLLKLDDPAIFIKVAGTARQPGRQPRGKARVRGPKAGRLIRFLADVCPPYGVSEIAGVTGLAPGYVSRLLDTLDSEAIVDRSRRGRVEGVTVEALLRRWAQHYDLLKTNAAMTFIAPAGVAAAISRLAELTLESRLAITGSFAASRLAPVAAPVLLALYADDTGLLVSSLRLLPADEGANIALLKPFDAVVYYRTTWEDGLSYVAPSQAVVDCLSGNGRMPAEGEALLAWMKGNESQWRSPSLESFTRLLESR
jgi:hypothetical protein